MTTELVLESKDAISNVSNVLTTPSTLHFSNLTDDEHVLYPLGWVIPITVVYAIIFLTGIVGNISTCIVIARNKSLHTVTNYYLFSIAISDLLLLISGLPPEMYRIWSPETYVFGEVFCVLQGFFAETSANATVLAITAFTVERYLAICHPFLSHTMSNLSRAIKYIIAIWIIALCLAAPQAIQFGVEYETKNGFEYSRCTVITTAYMEHAFEISTFLFFVGPMTLITALYILIAIKLRKSRMLGRSKRTCSATSSVGNGSNTAVGNGALGNGTAVIATSYMDARAARRCAAQNRVIKMLVAVVVAFCICWAPFHAQRLLAVYLAGASAEAQAPFIPIYIALMYISGVLYFLSTSINPVLYHIMSNKFREAFKDTATCTQLCRKPHRHHHNRNYSYDLQQLSTLTHRSYSTTLPSAKGTPPHPSQRPYQRSVSDFHPTRFVGRKALRPIVISEKSDVGEECSLQLKEQENGRGRVSSTASQMTVMTNFSLVKDKKNSTNISKRNRINEQHSYVSKLAQWFSAFQWHKRRPIDIHGLEANGENKRPLREGTNGADMFTRQGSVESATISNSSLQDLEEMEFSSTDLMRYMEEINDDIA